MAGVGGAPGARAAEVEGLENPGVSGGRGDVTGSITGQLSRYSREKESLSSRFI